MSRENSGGKSISGRENSKYESLRWECGSKRKSRANEVRKANWLMSGGVLQGVVKNLDRLYGATELMKLPLHFLFYG